MGRCTLCEKGDEAGCSTEYWTGPQPPERKGISFHPGLQRIGQEKQNLFHLNWFRLNLIGCAFCWFVCGADVGFLSREVSDHRLDYLCYSGQAEFVSSGGTNQVIYSDLLQP